MGVTWPVSVATTVGGAWSTAWSSSQVDGGHVVARDDERLSSGIGDLCLEPGEVGAGRGAGRLRRVALAERRLDELQVRDRDARDLAPRLRRDRDDVRGVLDRDRDVDGERAAGEARRPSAPGCRRDEERRRTTRRRAARRPACDRRRRDRSAGACSRRSQGLPGEDDHRPGRADDRQRREQRHLRPVLGLHRRDQQRAEEADRERVDPPPARRLRRRPRVGDHEREEDEHLRREDEHLPEVVVRDRAEVPVRGERVAAQGQDAESAART